MGVAIWGISKKTYDDMSEAAISSLNENLTLMKSTIEAIFRSEADFQRVTAKELAETDDPIATVAHMPNGETASCVSYVPANASEGISNNGEPFNPARLDFSSNENILGLAVSQSYVNTMGTWAYTVACPVERSSQTLGTLYMEYTFDTIDEALPRSFYGNRAVLYLMDITNERFVLKPEGMGERDAGHVNLEDFYRANKINDANTLEMVATGIDERRNVMFAHEVQGQESLCFLWSVSEGTFYLVGYVPMNAIQQEAQAVNMALMLVAGITALAFCLCVVLFAINRRKQLLAQRARDLERAEYARAALSSTSSSPISQRKQVGIPC